MAGLRGKTSILVVLEQESRGLVVLIKMFGVRENILWRELRDIGSV